MKTQVTIWEKIFSNHISAKEFFLYYIKNSQKSIVRKQTNKSTTYINILHKRRCTGGY